MKRHIDRMLGGTSSGNSIGIHGRFSGIQKFAMVLAFMAIETVVASEPAVAVSYVPTYDNGVYVGCTVYYNFIEEFLFDVHDRTDSPAIASESLCRWLQAAGIAQPRTSVHVSAYEFEDFNNLATESLSGFTPLPERGPDGSFQVPAFDTSIVESGTQAGVGAALRLNDWLALDLGLTVGSGTASRSSNLPRAREEARFRLYGGSLAAKVYPLQRGVARVQPWLSAGVRSLTLRPTGGTYTTFREGEQRLDLSGRRFQPASTTDFASGIGLDFRLTDGLGVTVSGEHGFRTGWRAGASLSFTWSSPRPTSGALVGRLPEE